MDKKTIVITGGAKRIGRHIVEYYAKQGCSIVFQYYESQAEAAALLAEGEKQGWKIRAIQGDMRDPAFPKKFIAFALAEFGELHLLINNASTFHQSPLEDLTLEEFDDNFNVNLRAPILLTQAFAKGCPQGHIINMIDRSITSHRIDQISYLLSKKALAEFTKMAARALAPIIRVNGIAPGRILPPVNHQKEKITESDASHIPLQRTGSLNDITDAIDALEKLSYVTGQIIFVSGGKELNDQN